MRYMCTIVHLECCKCARIWFHCANGLAVLRSCAPQREQCLQCTFFCFCHQLNTKLLVGLTQWFPNFYRWCLITFNKIFFTFQVENFFCSDHSYNTDEHCDFGFALPPEESHITPDGVIYPQLRNHFPHCIYFISGCAAFSSWSLQVWSQLYTEFFQMTGMTNTLMERLKPAASNSASTRTCSRWTRISSIKLSPLRWESCVKMNKNLKTNDFNETVV